MNRKDGQLYYNIRETGYHIERTAQTIMNWIEINKELKEQGRPGRIPEPTLINNVMHFSVADIKTIKDNMKSFKRGDFKEFHKKTTTYDKLKDENRQLISKINELKGGVKN